MARPLPARPVSAGWVVGASVTMPWFVADEATPITEGLRDAPGQQALRASTRLALKCMAGHRPMYRAAS
jgi:hypothetical protein